MSHAFRAAILAVVLFLGAVAAQAFNASDRLVDPTERVGAVMEGTSEADLAKVYGSTNITHVPMADKNLAITVLFAGTPNELCIEWKNVLRSPSRIIITGAAWKTADGLAVGTPMDEIERVNDGPFDVTGSNWDRPVRVVSWKGGKLPPRLQVDLAPMDPAADFPKRLQSRRQFFESTNPTLRNAHLVIKRLIIEW